MDVIFWGSHIHEHMYLKITDGNWSWPRRSANDARTGPKSSVPSNCSRRTSNPFSHESLHKYPPPLKKRSFHASQPANSLLLHRSVKADGIASRLRTGRPDTTN